MKNNIIYKPGFWPQKKKQIRRKNLYVNDYVLLFVPFSANMVVLSNGEVMEFPVPTEEKLVEPDLISLEERKVHLEFFDGRLSKTPDRYVKIRNYILDSW